MTIISRLIILAEMKVLAKVKSIYINGELISRLAFVPKIRKNHG
jgi:hypothetical protein